MLELEYLLNTAVDEGVAWLNSTMLTCVFVVFALYSSPAALYARATETTGLSNVFGHGLNGSVWVTTPIQMLRNRLVG